MTRPERTVKMLRALQGVMGLTNDEMAARLSISHATWSQYKGGDTDKMRVSTWWRLCDLCSQYGVHIDREDENYV